jgi:pyridoxal phosphate enzyme (YggS family)
MAKLDSLADLPLEWHFIGQIQANKTRGIAERFQWVHSVDRLRIAERLNEQRPGNAPPLDVCIQVRLAPEPGKGGVDVPQLQALALQVAALPKLRLRGLMCTPPPTETFAEQRAWHAALAEQRDHLNAKGLSLDTLSMGMSADLEAAIDAGATIVRVGTALFGERTYNRRSG